MALLVFSGKVSPEVQEQFNTAKEASEAMTFNAFMELLLEAYLNPKTKPVEVARPTTAQIEEVQLKENEIGRLKTDIDFKNEEIARDQEQLSTLRNIIAGLEDQLGNGAGLFLNENQEVINIPPIIGLILDKEAATAMKKSGKQFSRGEILTNCFWETIKEGRYTPFLIWNSREIAAAVKSLQIAE